MRLIDADALLTERKKSKYYHLPNGDVAIPIIDIKHAPTVETERIGILQSCQPVGIGIMRWKCSECGEVYDNPVNYCNYCGFKLIRQIGR